VVVSATAPNAVPSTRTLLVKLVNLIRKLRWSVGREEGCPSSFDQIMGHNYKTGSLKVGRELAT
jgi:hypothetical protein